MGPGQKRAIPLEETLMMNEQGNSLEHLPEQGIEPLSDWALEPEGKPEEFGLAKDSRPSNRYSITQTHS